MSPVRRTWVVLLVTAVLPLALGLGVLVWRAGHETRLLEAVELTGEAEFIAARIRSVVLAPGASAELVTRALEATAPDRAAAVVLGSDGWQPAAAHRMTVPSGLREPLRRRLESLDRSFTASLDGRITAVAPVKDADQWDILGAVIVQRTDRDPPRWPIAPSLIALLATVSATVIARWASSRAQAFASLPAAVGPLREFAPAIAFTALAAIAFYLVGTFEVAASGLWSAAAFAAWLVFAGVGFSLARTAARPLQFREASCAWMFLAPSLVHLLVFSLGPIVFSLWLSFHEWDLLSQDRPFVGLSNYRTLAADPEFLRSLGNTAIYVLFVPIGMAVALAIALLLNRRIPGVRALRAIFFLPYITSFVAISLVWRWMFQPDIGLLNGVLARIGLPAQPWLSSPATALPSLMLMSVWMYAGYMMIIFLAGLQSIPESLYESARIDGANAWQRFRHITLPMLQPTTLFLLVTMVIFMFQVFTAVYVMTEGGPLHATDVIVYHIYRNAWEYLRMGYASAMAWVLFAIVFVITLVQFRFLGSRPAQ